jgi:hypothetical protein
MFVTDGAFTPRWVARREVGTASPDGESANNALR